MYVMKLATCFFIYVTNTRILKALACLPASQHQQNQILCYDSHVKSIESDCFTQLMLYAMLLPEKNLNTLCFMVKEKKKDKNVIS